MSTLRLKPPQMKTSFYWEEQGQIEYWDIHGRFPKRHKVVNSYLH